MIPSYDHMILSYDPITGAEASAAVAGAEEAGGGEGVKKVVCFDCSKIVFKPFLGYVSAPSSPAPTPGAENYVFQLFRFLRFCLKANNVQAQKPNGAISSIPVKAAN